MLSKNDYGPLFDEVDVKMKNLSFVLHFLIFSEIIKIIDHQLPFSIDNCEIFEIKSTQSVTEFAGQSTVHFKLRNRASM